MFRSLMTEGDLPVARVARSLALLGAATPADISRDTGLARSTISGALTELRERGIVIALDVQNNPMGRPSQPYALSPDAGRCAGILFGLAEVRIAICDVSHEVLADVSIPMPKGYGPTEAAVAIGNRLPRMCGDLGFSVSDLLGAGLAVSAPVSSAGIVLSGSILPSWHGTDLGQTFGPVLNCPIHAANESNCGALAEMMWGNARGEDDFVLFKCSLGIGGAIIIDGKVRIGAEGHAGEFGHMTLQPDGPLCVCGKRGCLEAIAGGARLVRLANEVADHPFTLSEMVRAAREGHPGCRRLLEDAAATIGWAISLIATSVDPKCFVITGEMAETGELFLNRIRETYDRFVAPQMARLGEGGPRIELGRFLGNDTVVGAVALVLRREARVV